jgi:hypothetical protein
MFADDKGTVLVSSMGWVDRSDLWVLEVMSGTPRRVPIGTKAKYLMPHAGATGYFSVGHHFDVRDSK